MLSLENAINSRFFFHTEQNYQYFSPTEIKSKEYDESDKGEREPLSPYVSFPFPPSIEMGQKNLNCSKFWTRFPTLSIWHCPTFFRFRRSYMVQSSLRITINSEICPQFKYSYHTFKTPTVSKLESMGSVLCSFGIVEHH